MRTRAWRWFALAGGGLLAAFAGAPAWLHWWLLSVVELLVLAAVVAGPRLHGVTHRRPWRLAAVAMAAVAAADTAMTVLHAVGAPAAVVTWTDLGFPVGYLCYGAAVWSLVWARSAGGGRREVLTDGAIVAVGIALVLWQLLSPPDPARSLGLAPGPATRLLTAAYPLMLAVVTAVTVLLVFTAARWLRSARFILLAGLGMLAANSAYLLLQRTGGNAFGSWADLLWPLAYLFVGLAALHPSMAELSALPAPGAVRMPFARVTVLAVALVLTQASILAADDRPAAGVRLTVVSVMLAGVALWRMVALLRERELARAGLRRTIERQALVAELGRRALTGADDDELLAGALDGMAEDLGGAWAVFMEPGPDGRWLRVRAARGPVPAAAASWAVPAAGDVAVVDAEGGRAVLVPVRGRRLTFGVLAGQAPGGQAVGPAEEHFVGSVANVLAGAFEHRLAQDEVRRQALHDPLTGLPNRVLLAERINAALASPFRLDEAVVRISGSIGVVVADAGEGGGDGTDALMRRADAAMYRAKQLGRGRSEVAAGR